MKAQISEYLEKIKKSGIRKETSEAINSLNANI